MISSRAFVPTIPARPYRQISRHVKTNLSPVNIDIMHTIDRTSFSTSVLLSLFTITRMIMNAAETSVSHDSDSYDADSDEDSDEDSEDGELIPIKIPIKEDHERGPQA